MTYNETILRYRIVRHDDLPEAHKAEYRAMGIDPDDVWSLVWSFANLKNAEACLAREQEEAPKWRTYRLVDGGAAEVIERHF